MTFHFDAMATLDRQCTIDDPGRILGAPPTATTCLGAHHLNGVSAAAPAITPMIHCYLTAWKAPAMPGCIPPLARMAGRAQGRRSAALTAMGIAMPSFQMISRKTGTRMMGGLGSGRPTGSGRDTVEACRSIDVNQLHRKGCLRAGAEPST